jgi:hypothetical protein
LAGMSSSEIIHFFNYIWTIVIIDIVWIWNKHLINYFY